MRHAVHFSALLLAFAVASPALAQSNASLALSPLVDSAAVSAIVSAPARPDPSVQPTTDVDQAGASMTGLRAGVHARETARPDRPLLAAQSQHMGQDRAMMVVGVAALITGAIIGGAPGTIVMVGGAVVGLLGLYNYMQ